MNTTQIINLYYQYKKTNNKYLIYNWLGLEKKQYKYICFRSLKQFKKSIKFIESVRG